MQITNREISDRKTFFPHVPLERMDEMVIMRIGDLALYLRPLTAHLIPRITTENVLENLPTDIDQHPTPLPQAEPKQSDACRTNKKYSTALSYRSKIQKDINVKFVGRDFRTFLEALKYLLFSNIFMNQQI